jgi:hypothetical protein
MKPSILDNIEPTPSGVPTETIKEDATRNAWESKGEYGYDGLMSLIEDNQEKEAKTKTVIDNIRFFKSKVIVYENYVNKNKILILPKVYIAIDLFHKITHYKLEDLIRDIKENICYLYSLDEAYIIFNALQMIDNYTLWNTTNASSTWSIKRGETIAYGKGYIGESREIWRHCLSYIYQSDQNWKSGYSYLDKIDDFRLSLLNHHVFCYEDSTCYSENGKYLYETRKSHDIPKSANGKEIMMFSCSDSGALKFLGCYELDLTKSEQEESLVFERIRDIT